jgi:hypothetical protein
VFRRDDSWVSRRLHPGEQLALGLATQLDRATRISTRTTTTALAASAISEIVLNLASTQAG